MNLTKIINSSIFTIGVITCITYAATTITTITQTAVNGDTVSAAWVNEVNSKLASGTPTGFIGAFYLTTCPTGWLAADGSSPSRPDLRGMFLRGINTFDSGLTTRADGKQDPAGSRAIGSYQNEGILGANVIDTQTRRYSYWTTAYTTSIIGDDVHTGNKKTLTEFYTVDSNETHPKNIGVIYCIKQ